MNTPQDLYNLQSNLSQIFDNIGITQELKGDLSLIGISSEELTQISFMIEKLAQLLETNHHTHLEFHDMLNQRLLIRLGNFYYIQDNPDKALKYYKIANDVLESEWAYYNTGKIYMEFNDLQKAFEQYDQAIKCKPDFAKALRNQGIILLNLNKPEEAIGKLKKSQNINPNDLKTSKLLVDLYIQQGAKQEALRHLKAVEKKTPEDREIKAKIQQLEGRKSVFKGILDRFRKDK